MYFVKYGNKYLHDPRVSECHLLDLSLDVEENSCGYCDFTIYPDHPMYDMLKERDALNPIEVYDDDVLLFAGFIYELGKEFYLDGHVKCKGELEYLSETVVRPYSSAQRGFGNKCPSTIQGYFEWLIDQHNNQASPEKQFTVGVNQGSTVSYDNYIFAENDSYPTTMNEIVEQLLNVFGGYITTRHENGVRYIDYLAEWTQTNTQILDFGVNLTDYTLTDDSEEIATYVVPIGARMSETEYPYDDGYFPTQDTSMVEFKEYYMHTYKQTGKIAYFEDGVTYYEKFTDTFITSDLFPVAGITYYTQEVNSDGSVSYNTQDIPRFTPGVTYYEQDDYYVETSWSYPNDEITYYIKDYGYSPVDTGKFRRYIDYFEYDPYEDESAQLLTIDGLTDFPPYERGYIQSGDMIYSASSVEEYGWIGMTFSDSAITTKEELLVYGTIALMDRISPKRTIEIKAVDMHFINPDLKPIRIGEYVRVRSTPHNLDSYFLCRSIDLDLNNPQNSLYTLGTTFDTLTGQQNKRINALNASVNKNQETVTALESEVKATAKEASKTATEAKNIANKASAAVQNVGDISAKVDNMETNISSSVVSVVEEYATTATSDTAPTTGWTTTVPASSDSYFVWRRLITTNASGNQTIGSPALLVGNKGEDGIDGSNGKDGVDGKNGKDGNDGVGVAGIYQYYILHSSGSTPAVPTTYPPSSSWSTTEPAYDKDSIEVLYTVECTVFDNGNFKYSPVTLSSSYTAAKQANDKINSYIYHDVENGLQIGDKSSGDWYGTRSQILNGAYNILDQDGTQLASFNASGISFNAQATFKADGIMIDNADAFTELGKNQILWSSTNGYWMSGTQSITLSANITRQLSGVVFAWCYYVTETSSASNGNWVYFFLPKSHILNHPGTMVCMDNAYRGMAKRLGISNGRITGVDSNKQSGTTNGIAFDNTRYVLKYVIGV